MQLPFASQLGGGQLGSVIGSHIGGG